MVTTSGCSPIGVGAIVPSVGMYHHLVGVTVLHLVMIGNRCGNGRTLSQLRMPCRPHLTKPLPTPPPHCHGTLTSSIFNPLPLSNPRFPSKGEQSQSSSEGFVFDLPLGRPNLVTTTPLCTPHISPRQKTPKNEDANELEDANWIVSLNITIKEIDKWRRLLSLSIDQFDKFGPSHLHTRRF